MTPADVRASSEMIPHKHATPWILLASVLLAMAGAGEERGGIQLDVHLTDGSHLIGTPLNETPVTLQTNLGEIQLPLERIDEWTHGDGADGWVFKLRNGDSIEGKLALRKIEINTLFGRVAVDPGHIVSIEVATRNDLAGLPRKGLILHYAFDAGENGIDDLSGKDNQGVSYGAKIVPDGVNGSALSLDGQSAHVDMGSGPIAALPTWDDYTISVWFLNNGKGGPNRGYGEKIIDKTTMYHDFYLCVKTSGALSFFTYEGSGAGLQDDGHDYRDSKWHHAVVVKKGAHGELWVDGQLKVTGDGLKRVNSKAPLLLGTSKSSDAFQRRPWSGRLDDLRIYDRPLSKREVGRLFTPHQ